MASAAGVDEGRAAAIVAAAEIWIAEHPVAAALDESAGVAEESDESVADPAWDAGMAAPDTAAGRGAAAGVKAEPRRTCLGCRQVAAKRTMMRLVRAEDGQVRVDRPQRAAGRGAYVCPTAACVRAAFSRSRLGHAFRRPSDPPAREAAVILDILG